MANHDSLTVISKSSLRVWFYFAAVLCWTWCFWIPLVWVTNRMGDLNVLPFQLRMFLLIILQTGAYGPSIVAIFFSLGRWGGSGIKTLLSKLLIWRIPVARYGFVLLAPILFQVFAIIIYAYRGGVVGSIDFARAVTIPLQFLLMLTFGPLAEELGWRGYALPRLIEGRSAVKASLLIACIVTIWHMPLFFSSFPPVDGVSFTDSSILVYFLLTSGKCIIYTWIYQNTGGSVLATMLFHAVNNTSVPLILLPGIASDASSAIWMLSVVPIWMTAAFLIARFGSYTLNLNLPPKDKMHQ